MAKRVTGTAIRCGALISPTAREWPGRRHLIVHGALLLADGMQCRDHDRPTDVIGEILDCDVHRDHTRLVAQLDHAGCEARQRTGETFPVSCRVWTTVSERDVREIDGRLVHEGSLVRVPACYGAQLDPLPTSGSHAGPDVSTIRVSPRGD